MVLNLALAVILAYLVSAASVGPAYVLMAGGWNIFEGLMLTPMVVMFAFPGFVVLRTALALSRQRSLVIFGLAGLANGVVSSFGFLQEFVPPLALAGLIAGLVYHLIEKRVSGAIIVRSSREAT